MLFPHITSAAVRTPEQRRSTARRLITTLSAAVFVVALPLTAVHAYDNDPVPTPSPIPTYAPTPPPTATAPIVPVQVRSVVSPPAAAVNPTAGLTQVGDGGAAFYAPGYDNGGWDAIIRTHMRGGQGDPKTFPYSPEGYYCVHPDFVFGNVLTLQNPETGKTIRCTVADAVAPGDQGYWRSRFVIELSYASFTALGLDRSNHVTVWAAA